MPSQPLLETARLTLRLLSVADLSFVQSAASSFAIADSMISIPHPFTEIEAKHYLTRRLEESDSGCSVTFLIETKQREPLGLIEVRNIEPEHAVGEISYWLAVEAQGQGFMSEAIAAILSYSFKNLGLNRLYAYHMVRNPASGKVLQKNGFQLEGVLRQRVRKWGVFEDVMILSILRQDWEDDEIY